MPLEAGPTDRRAPLVGRRIPLARRRRVTAYIDTPHPSAMSVSLSPPATSAASWRALIASVLLDHSTVVCAPLAWDHRCVDCLVLMPMFPEYGEVRSVVADSIASAGARMSRLEEAVADPEWQWWLIEAVNRADFVLADVTDHNPFVSYELGLTHNRRLPSLLIVNARNDAVTATVRGSPFLVYDDASLTGFREELTTEVETMMAAVAEPAPTCPPATAVLLDAYDKGCAQIEAVRAVGLDVHAVDQDEFCARMTVAWARGDRVSPWSESVTELTVLARLVAESDRVEVMAELRRWAGTRSNGEHPQA